MVRIAGEITIDRPVPEVFDFVADERNEPAFNARMRRVDLLTPEPIGVGSRFRAEMATGLRVTLMTIEFTGYDRPRRLGSVTRTAGMDIHGALTFEPVPAGTRMRWSWIIEPHGPLRLVGPVVSVLGRRQERATWASLKRLLEAPGRSRVEPGG